MTQIYEEVFIPPNFQDKISYHHPPCPLTIYVVWEYHVRAMVYKKEKT